MAESKMMQMHFRVDAQGITDLVRQMYHYENNPERALNILQQIDGLTLNDAYAILNGDAQFTSTDGVTLHLNRTPDEDYKSKLAAHKLWKIEQEKRNAEFEKEVASALSTMYENRGYTPTGVVRADEEVRKLTDGSRNQRALAQFEDLGYGFCKSCPEEKECRSLLYACDRIKENLAKANIPPSYYVSISRYLSGKPRINRDAFKDVRTVEVYNLCGIEVRKELLDKYVSDIITRLRSRQQNPDRRELWYVEEMENVRRNLHIEILREAGYEIMEMSEGAQLFRAMIEQYLENKAKLYGVV